MTTQSGAKNKGNCTGRIVAAYGRQVVVEDGDGQRHRCLLSGRRLSAVCVDKVQWHLEESTGAEGLVVSVAPRETELARPDNRGRLETIVSNITQVVIVVAPKPAPDPGMIDRYLVAAEGAGIAAAVVANKSDTATVDLSEFAEIGYSCVSVSAKQPATLGTLEALLAGQTSVLVGQSGVGKSSLLNGLIPGLSERTQSLSAGSGEGRHTTTSSALFHINNGGEVIDSPGVRDYAPPPVDDIRLGQAFREFRDYAPECKFNDCRHLSEPGCGVKKAVADNRIAQRRYASYQRLLRRLARLDPGY